MNTFLLVFIHVFHGIYFNHELHESHELFIEQNIKEMICVDPFNPCHLCSELPDRIHLHLGIDLIDNS